MEDEHSIFYVCIASNLNYDGTIPGYLLISCGIMMLSSRNLKLISKVHTEGGGVDVHAGRDNNEITAWP